MCGTCHVKDDPDFPSVLHLVVSRGNCPSCHMALENVDAGWVEGAGKRIRILGPDASRGYGGPAREFRDALEAELEERGFALVDGAEADLVLSLALACRRLREERFLPPGYAVFRARVTAVLRRPGDEEILFRRDAESRPEYDRTGDAAAARAARDAWRVLRTHLLEELGAR